MSRNQKILAILVGVAAVVLILLLLINPPDPREISQWTPPAGGTTLSETRQADVETETPAPIPPSGLSLPTGTPTTQPTLTGAPLPTETGPAVQETPQPEQPLPLPSPTSPAVPEIQGDAAAFFVAPDGNKEGDGSIEQPWELQYALNHPDRIKPGDTIWLRGGEYRGSWVLRLEGEEGKPITVRAYPGERAILTNDDRVLDISDSHYVILWGLEITASENSRDPINRPETAYGVRINQGKTSHHIKFVNMIVHDMPAQGFGWWMANTDSEIYGSLIYFNGVNQFDHGVYMMNETGTKRLADNFIFDNASHGVHAYGKDTQWLNNFVIEGNTVFNNGSIGFTTTRSQYGIYKRNILVGGYNVAANPVIINNYTYYPGSGGEALNLGFRAGSSNAVVENNYFAGGSIELAGVNNGVSMLRNTIMGMGASMMGIMQNGQNDWLAFKPQENRIFIRPNEYEAGRANLTIYNWSNQEQVTIPAAELQGVDISAGDTYELHNVQDYFNDVITGTYDGEKLVVPMTNHSVAQPLGLSFKPASTFPEFGAFVLIVHGSEDRAAGG